MCSSCLGVHALYSNIYDIQFYKDIGAFLPTLEYYSVALFKLSPNKTERDNVILF